MADGGPDALVGTVLGGVYRLTREIGRGGMGAVYEGVQLRLNRRVAVKLMARELARNTEALARFRREAEVTSQLGHPHIVQVFDFGEAPTGEPYLVMEFLEGEDLDGRLRRAGRLPAAAAAHIIKQVASALAATHAKGIVHRDLKPANVFVLAIEGETDFVKVVDFGISKVKAATTRLTSAAAVMGTPNYMSPEQAAGRVDEIDNATDQWALACIAYEMLAGRPPFVGDNVASLLYQVVHEAPAPLAASAPGLAPGIEEVLRCALAKRPAERFASVTAFARAFEGAATGAGGAHGLVPAVAAVPTMPPGASVPGAPAVAPTGLSATRAPTDAGQAKAAVTTFSAAAGEALAPTTSAAGGGGRRRLALGAGVVAVAAVAVAAIAISTSHGSSRSAQVAASAAPAAAPSAAPPTPSAAPPTVPPAPAVAPAPTPVPAPAAARPAETPVAQDRAPGTRARRKGAKGTTTGEPSAPRSAAPESPAAAPAPSAAAADAPTWPPAPNAAQADAPTWPPPARGAAGAPDSPASNDGAKPPRQRRHLMRDLKQKIFGD